MSSRIYLEASGYSMAIDQFVGSGGFGEVYDHADNHRYVLKLAVIDERKLRYLVGRPFVPSSPGYTFYWPADLAKEGDRVVGYAMPKVPAEAVDLLAVLAAAHWLPEEFLMRVAKNHASALVDLHRTGLIRGDLPNSMVGPDATGHEIDLDSVAVYGGSVEWHCGTGKRDFSAPEVQPLLGNGEFRSTPEHDAWALMVLTWVLLMDGCHPFDCHWKSSEPRPDRWERVRDGIWPYAKHCPEAEPRRGDPPINQLPPEVRRLAVKTFDRGALEPNRRPDIEEILDALESLDIDADVTLSDNAWEAVRTGSDPSRIKTAVRATKKPRVVTTTRYRRSLVAASLLGIVTLVAMGERTPMVGATLGSISNQLRLPSWLVGREPEPTHYEDLDSFGELEAIELHRLAGNQPGEAPALWETLRRMKR